MRLKSIFTYKKSNGIHKSGIMLQHILTQNLTAFLADAALIFACILGSYISSLSFVTTQNQNTLQSSVTYSESTSDSELILDNYESIFPTLNEENAADIDSSDNRSQILTSLYAKYAVIMDADTQRILLGKNETTSAPNASTTKIMTCIIALEYGNFDTYCTTSKYAASMPDVQLNANTGEMFHLRDLLYSLMLKSHNDTAVIIAENVAYHYCFQVLNGNWQDEDGILTDVDLSFLPDSSTYDSTFLNAITTDQSKILVSVFAGLMNQKAMTLGCSGTHFITPNGLDASDEDGVHSTTPVDLATIMSYCIQNQDFLSITETSSYSFQSYKTSSSGDVVNDDSYSVTNANSFLNMYDNIISGKTGFTNDAGYCYVCAYQCENRSFIVVLLACGWPNNKTYKWHDTRILLNWAREKYFMKDIVDTDLAIRDVQIKNGQSDQISVSVSKPFQMLLSDFDVVNVIMNVPTTVSAPVNQGDQVGTVNVYVNDTLVTQIPVVSNDNVKRSGFFYFLNKLLKMFTLVDN